MDMKDIVIKAAFGALQAALAELAVIQIVDQNTMYAALVGALLRGGVAFLNELKPHFKTPVKTSRKKLVQSHWFKRCW